MNTGEANQNNSADTVVRVVQYTQARSCVVERGGEEEEEEKKKKMMMMIERFSTYYFGKYSQH